MTKATMIPDKSDANTIRVESFDDDGGCEVSTFSGPHALDRAVHFISYYDSWSDPVGLLGSGQ